MILQLCLLPSLPTLEPGQGESPRGALADAHSVASGISEAAGPNLPTPNSTPGHVFPTTPSMLER